MKTDFYLANTQTANNLAKAFAGECQARTRYLFYADTAKEEGYPTLERIFLETADNERGHAEVFYDYLVEGLGKEQILTDVLVPIASGNTSQNLLYAADGEHEEWTNLYPEFGKIAEREGFTEIAESFYEITNIEKRHDERFMYLLNRMKQGMLYELPIESTWKCINCGLHYKGNAAPKICPACKHSQAYYMTIFDEEYPYE